jgi:hypothetical protein
MRSLVTLLMVVAGVRCVLKDTNGIQIPVPISPGGDPHPSISDPRTEYTAADSMAMNDIRRLENLNLNQSGRVDNLTIKQPETRLPQGDELGPNDRPHLSEGFNSRFNNRLGKPKPRYDDLSIKRPTFKRPTIKKPTIRQSTIIQPERVGGALTIQTPEYIFPVESELDPNKYPHLKTPHGVE